MKNCFSDWLYPITLFHKFILLIRLLSLNCIILNHRVRPRLSPAVAHAFMSNFFQLTDVILLKNLHYPPLKSFKNRFFRRDPRNRALLLGGRVGWVWVDDWVPHHADGHDSWRPTQQSTMQCCTLSALHYLWVFIIISSSSISSKTIFILWCVRASCMHVCFTWNNRKYKIL